MPLTRIELPSGKSQEFKVNLINLVSDVLVEILRLPNDDRNIRLLEYAKNNFIMKRPYEILIEITLFKGRPKETKKELYRKIVEVLERKLQIAKDSIFIVLNEQPLENWGIRGGISAEDVTFNFKIDK